MASCGTSKIGKRAIDFLKYISTPANTTEAEPLVTTIKLTRGRLNGGFLFFPSGPAGLLHFLARVSIHQIAPFNTGENYRLDDCVIPFHLSINLLEPPYEVYCVTWNDSTQYAHALSACFFLEPIGEELISLDALKKALTGTKDYQEP